MNDTQIRSVLTNVFIIRVSNNAVIYHEVASALNKSNITRHREYTYYHPGILGPLKDLYLPSNSFLKLKQVQIGLLQTGNPRYEWIGAQKEDNTWTSDYQQKELIYQTYVALSLPLTIHPEEMKLIMTFIRYILTKMTSTKIVKMIKLLRNDNNDVFFPKKLADFFLQMIYGNKEDVLINELLGAYGTQTIEKEDCFEY